MTQTHTADTDTTDPLSGLDMPLQEAMLTQRSIRRLRPDPVDDAIILKCIELALKAPTGSNAQNWEWIIVRDEQTKAKFGRLNRFIWRFYSKTANSASDSQSRGLSKIMEAVQWQLDHFEETPALVVPCLRSGKIPLLPMPPIIESSFYGSIYPSVQNFLLAARAMNLGASLITLPLWSMTAARIILGLPLKVQPCCMIPVGWPQGHYGPTQRKSVESVVHLDRYGHQPFKAPEPR